MPSLATRTSLTLGLLCFVDWLAGGSRGRFRLFGRHLEGAFSWSWKFLRSGVAQCSPRKKRWMLIKQDANVRHSSLSSCAVFAGENEVLGRRRCFDEAPGFAGGRGTYLCGQMRVVER